MTERIDLDDIETETREESDDEETGDWFWGDGDAPEQDASDGTTDASDGTTDASDGTTDASDGTTDASDGTTDASDAAADATDGTPDTPDGPSDTGDTTADASSDDESAADESRTGAGSPSSETNATRVPHVPAENKDKPAGIPVDSGGSGGGAASGHASEEDAAGGGGVPGSSSAGSSANGGGAGGGGAGGGGASSGGTTGGSDAAQAAGPHGGGADDLTFAFTFEAVQRLSDVRSALAEANEWADWIGIVGNVEAHEINRFLRETGLDIDFFNGSGTGPGERLAEIGPSSMFYADRMAVVGVEDAGDESIAAAADWEFVPLAHAADRADWPLDGE